MCPTELSGVPTDHHPGVERHEIAWLDRQVAARRDAMGLRDVIHATSCVAGVVTPADAIASMNTPVRCRSETPGASSATAAPSAGSATRTDAGWRRPPRAS